MTLRQMGTARSPLDWPDPETIDRSELEVIGQHLHVAYARVRDGRELRMGTRVMPWEHENRPAPNEVWVQSVVTVPGEFQSSRRPAPTELMSVRAYVVEPGTYEKLVAGTRARDEKLAAAAVRAATPHRVDAAELMPALDRVPLQPIALDAHAKGILPGRGGKNARLVTTGGREAIRGVEAIAGWLSAQGVQLRVTGGRLDVRSTAMSPATREVIDTFGELLIGHLTGKPTPCALGHLRAAPAFTLAVGGLPVCRDHLEEL